MSEKSPWPEGEFVSLDVITQNTSFAELSNLWSALKTGMKIGSGDTLVHEVGELEGEALEAIEPYAGYMGRIKVSWGPEPTRGQMVVKGPMNSVGFIVPSYWGSDENAKLVKIQFGCKHDFRIHSRRNCYSEGTCEKCGQWYACDSGD